MYKFINPYNFIPMGEEKSKADFGDGKRLLRGVIDYSVLTKTPLFIPNTSFNRFYGGPAEHKSYPFFSYIDYNIAENRKNVPNPEPVIPGSEIRGMFRSNYEILTNSCMSALDSDMMLSKRTMESYTPGLLRRVQENDGTVHYDLYKALDVLWRTMGENNPKADLHWKNDSEHKRRKCYVQEDFLEGAHVSFILRKRYNKDGQEIKPLALDVELFQENEKRDKKCSEGYVIKGEEGPTKHCCHIFTPVSRGSNLIESEVKMSLLDDLLQIYASNKLENASCYIEYRKRYDEFKRGEGCDYFPVYYCRIQDAFDRNKMKIFLSPACKTRELYDNTLKNLAGKLAPCTSESGFCEACELFGTITSDGESKSSKLRFTDLTVERKENSSEYYLPAVTLPELSSPKLNNMEFYVKRPGDVDGKRVWFWTYDYFIDEDRRLHLEQGRLAGRKFYWHQELDDDFKTKEEKGERNVTVRPLRTKSIFHGKLYFENISKETLDKLIYLINAGEGGSKEISEKEHGYKIGMAKPLGFGSIACNVDKVRIKSYEIKGNMPVRHDTPYEVNNFSEIEQKLKNQVGDSIIKNFHKMTEFESVRLQPAEHFSYPKVNEDSLGYEWFTENHIKVNSNRRGMPNTRKEMKFREYLEAMEPRVKSTECNVIREEEAEIEIGIVQPYSSKKPNVMKFKIGEGKAESIQCKMIGNGITPEEMQKRYPPQTEIKVCFQGINSNNFRVYKLIE